MLVLGGLAIVVRSNLLVLSGVVGSAIVAWIVSGGRRAGFRRLGLVRPARWRTIVLIALGAVFATGIVQSIVGAVVSPFFGQPDLSVISKLQGDPLFLLQLLVISWVNGAFAEEILFRGFLMPRLAEWWGGTRQVWVIAALLSSVVFGLGHAYQGVTGMVGTGMTGLVLAGVYLVAKRNLWASVLSHGLFDSIAFVTIYFTGLPAS